jgi:hypothetical protein
MNAIASPGPTPTSRAEERRFLGLPTWIKADRALTGGQFSLIEQVIPAGFESPLAYPSFRGRVVLCDRGTNVGDRRWQPQAA